MTQDREETNRVRTAVGRNHNSTNADLSRSQRMVQDVAELIKKERSA